MTVVFVFLLLSLTGCFIHFAALKEKHAYKLYRLLYLYLAVFLIAGKEAYRIINILLGVLQGRMFFSWNSFDVTEILLTIEVVMFLLAILILSVKERWKKGIFLVYVIVSIGFAFYKFVITSSPFLNILIENIMMPIIIFLFYLSYRQSKRAYVRFLFEKKSKIL